jgi:hypothetical protein
MRDEGRGEEKEGKESKMAHRPDIYCAFLVSPAPPSLIPFLTGGGAPCYTLNSSGKLSEVCISSHAPPDGSWKGYVFSDRTDERTHLAEPH